MNRPKLICVIVIFVLSMFNRVHAGAIFGSGTDLQGGFRWNAEYYGTEGGERSLVGGLRYSVQGGSLQAYRDLFNWSITPTLEEFELAIEQAFAAWTVKDPISGLGTTIYFVDDTANTDVSWDLSPLGAEIDLKATNPDYTGGFSWANLWASNDEVTLTSGTQHYPGTRSIIGADIRMNRNISSLAWFRRVLTHEIGHALGLADVERSPFYGFIDDNFDPNDPLNTLNNSWALLVDPFDPAASSGLHKYFTVERHHLQVQGVDLLMESFGVGVGVSNPVWNLTPLTNDEYGMRQFLYPAFIQRTPVPEPSTYLMFSLGLLWLFQRRTIK
ncbi:PEP-CTERM sorting domain-containing protein [Thalassotalea litorea]|uniref:PEP-CTERM sorting domain-containing protein n=1 Tax=Thalassotalea litorea TaxID=2020715 RepID=A0A5R9IF84_9GAMM|nr:PEP-CTERM sorting domain-containing protein [Thalassotalea litorea]TLU61214.1 PEP-CTERM sorting domain-containing protein [Thalassotalea litorea]